MSCVSNQPLGEWQEAEEVAREAVAAAERGERRAPDFARSLTRRWHVDDGPTLDEAAWAFQRALAVFRSWRSLRERAATTVNIGIIHSTRGRCTRRRIGVLIAALHGRIPNTPTAFNPRRFASLNLACFYRASRPVDLASERYEDALRAVTESSNEPHRLAKKTPRHGTTMAHLVASRAKDWATASSLYDPVVVPRRASSAGPSSSARGWTALAALAWVRGRVSEEERLCAGFARTSSPPEWWSGTRSRRRLLMVSRCYAETTRTRGLGSCTKRSSISDGTIRTLRPISSPECAHLRCDASTERIASALIDHQPRSRGPSLAGSRKRLSVLESALRSSRRKRPEHEC